VKRKKTLAYWRGFEAGLEGWSLLGLVGSVDRPEKDAEMRRGYAAGVTIRDALAGRVGAQGRPQREAPKSATWRAGYGAGKRGEPLDRPTWAAERPGEWAEMREGHAEGVKRQGQPRRVKPPIHPQRMPPAMTPPECADWEFRQKLFDSYRHDPT